jgi:chemotaxis protein MotB
MNTQPIIIIKKKRNHAHPHHGGAWKVAYADFVTAMMAFFLVMWITGQSAASRAAIAAYFRDPGAFESGRGSGVLDGGKGLTEGAAENSTAQAEEILRQAAQKLRREIEAVPEFAAIKDRIEITITPDGLLIELLEADDDGFFEVGSAVLRPKALKLLELITNTLDSLPNRVAIEGHTDSRAYQTAGNYTNWELSADRANAARRVLQADGMSAGRVSAVHGFADTKPRFPDVPLDARNRRISILVKR